MDTQRLRRRFHASRFQARKRGLLWDLTFEQYCGLWIESGYSTRVNSGIVLMRVLDEGDYTLENVRLGPQRDNMRECAGLHWLKRGRYGPLASYLLTLPVTLRERYLAKCLILGV